MNLTENQGLFLVHLAYSTLCERLGKQIPSAELMSFNEEQDDSFLDTVSGTFVTLKKNQSLRGCIGNLVSNVTIKEGIRSNAISAAFNDYRFTPLTFDELNSLDIEVSILTVPQNLVYSDWQDLLTKISVGTDGLILRQGTSSATFLPQVWKQLPQKESFLSNLCLKAGLSNETWKTSKLEIETYQVQSFSKIFR